MKTVYLVRHAKSSWDAPSLSDIQRPLNERGLADAPFMAKLLKGKGATPQAIFTSPAVRALTTATYFKIEFGLSSADFFVRDEIYEAFPMSILLLMRSLPEQYDSVMLFGHNPTFTSVANAFTNQYIDNIPTCGIACLRAEQAMVWADFTEKNAVLDGMFFPKEYR